MAIMSEKARRLANAAGFSPRALERAELRRLRPDLLRELECLRASPALWKAVLAGARHEHAEERRFERPGALFDALFPAAGARAARSQKATRRRSKRDGALKPTVKTLLQRGMSDRAIATYLSHRADEPGGDGRKVGREDVARIREALHVTPEEVRRIRGDLDLGD